MRDRPIRYGLSILITATWLLVACAQTTPSPAPTPTAIETTVPEATATAAPIGPVQTLPAPAIALAADPHDRRAAYALLITNALCRTTDRGQTWERLPLPAAEQPYESPLDPGNPNRVALLPQQDIVITQVAPGRLYVRADGTLCRSDDRGATWQALQDKVAAWTIGGPDDSYTYIWRAFDLPKDERGLYQSKDGGLTWRQMYVGFFPPSLREEAFAADHEGMTALLVNDTGVGELYAGTDFGIFRSLNAGRTWTEFNDGLWPTQRTHRLTPILVGGCPNAYALTEVSPDGQSGRAILAKLQHGQIIPDEDTWSVVGGADLSPYIRSDAPGFYGIHTLAPDPLHNDRLYLGTEDGVLVSEDTGNNWQPLDLPDSGAVYRIAVAPGDPAQLYLWTDRGLVTEFLPSASQQPMPGPASNEVQLEVIGQVGGQSLAVAVENNTAYVGIGPRLIVLDVADPTMPAMMGQSEVLPGVVQDIVVSGTLAYVAAGDAGLRVLDISDRSAPREVGFLLTGQDAQSVVIQGNIAYVAEGRCTGQVCVGGLSAVDIANPAAPREASVLEMPDFANDVATAAGYAYVAHAGGLQVVDIFDPMQLREVGALPVPGGVEDVVIIAQRAYLAGGSGLRVIDLSDPAGLREIGQIAPAGPSPSVVDVADGYAYIASVFCEFGYCGSGLYIIDVSNPANPREAGAWGASIAIADVDVVDGIAYVATWDDGLIVVDVRDAASPREIAKFSVPGSVSTVVVANGHAFVSGGGVNDPRIFDVSDPTRPREVGVIRDIPWAAGFAVQNGYAYIPVWEETFGFRVFDVSNPAAPRPIGMLDTTERLSEEYEVVVANGYAYVSVGTGGVWVIDVADPIHPRHVAVVETKKHVTAVVVDRGYLYMVSRPYEGDDREGVLSVIDVADPAKPREVGSLILPGWAIGVAVADGYAYVTLADCYYYSCSGGLRVVNVTEPVRPSLVGSLDLPDGAFDVAVADDRAYVAAGVSGVWVVDVFDPANPRVAGLADTPGRAWDIELVDEGIFVADGSGGLIFLRSK